MRELVQLEKQHADFDARRVRVVVISNDDHATAKLTQEDFPHLTVVADTSQSLANAVEVVHALVGPKFSDTNSPTTFLIDGAGYVRWVFRPDSFVVRLTPDELLEAIDKNLPRSDQ